jgi:DNA-directed RNA polymerase specialized sigma24 family protein
MLREKAVVDSFTEFLERVEPRLRIALIPTLGLDIAREATAEAFAYGWEHWDRLAVMDNPAGYLYRVALTAGRRTATVTVALPRVQSGEFPWVEPGLPDALSLLSARQRTAVWLVHGLGWRRTEVAELLGVSQDTVRTHTERGLAKLRSALGGVI